ncbi:hypothetical protein ABOC32_01825 [Pseudomonas sp. WOUb67]|uniref:hypothetical protein n=1 Tax=Pseudomonas sp. WOUb67 TaxID=3161136 RepID=UPI0029634DCD|nr:hypothetical protein [Pseudomonas putida]
MTREEIVALIEESAPSEPLMSASLLMVDYLLSDKVINHLTFTRISKIISAPDISLAILTVQYLTGYPLRILEAKFEFIDGDESYPVTSEELSEARRTGVFYHPESGQSFEGFETKIYPYFTIGQAFSQEAQ